MRPEQLDGYIPFDEIHALQIVSKSCALRAYAYVSSELNLILKDGARHNIIDHQHHKSIRSDAQQLSTALRIPIWDVS